MKKALVFSIIVLTLGVTFAIANTPDYTITDLGTLGGIGSWAQGINESGQVVGYSWLGGNTTHAFLYDGTTMHDLGTLDNIHAGGESQAHDINDNGQVVGWSHIDGYTHAFLYDGTTLHDLGTLGGTRSIAYGINNNGQIVGSSRIAGNLATHAFLYDGIVMHDLGTLGGEASEAYGINNNGYIVGGSLISGDSPGHAFIYNGTTMHDIGTLGGSASIAYGINNLNCTVGLSVLAEDLGTHAFLYDGTNMSDLDPSKTTISIANAINDNGHIVGYRRFPESPNTHAFLYDGQNMINLNDLLPADSNWELIQATDINNSGQIVGWGHNPYPHAFLMTPVLGPVDLVVELAETINGLGLPAGTENSLQVKLHSALKALEDDNENNDGAAVNSLEAFINAVNAQRGKKISEEDADYLITTAQQIIDMLSGQ